MQIQYKRLQLITGWGCFQQFCFVQSSSSATFGRSQRVCGVCCCDPALSIWICSMKQDKPGPHRAGMMQSILHKPSKLRGISVDIVLKHFLKWQQGISRANRAKPFILSLGKMTPWLFNRSSDHPRSQELLYYVGRVDVQQGKVSVGIHSFPAKQPPFALQDADYTAAWMRITYSSCPLWRVLGLNMYVKICWYKSIYLVVPKKIKPTNPTEK